MTHIQMSLATDPRQATLKRKEKQLTETTHLPVKARHGEHARLDALRKEARRIRRQRSAVEHRAQAVESVHTRPRLFKI